MIQLLPGEVKVTLRCYCHLPHSIFTPRSHVQIIGVMSQHSFWLVPVIVVVSWSCYRLFRTYWRLRDVPGPFWAKLTDLERWSWVKTFRSHEIYEKIHEDYGNVVRVGPNMVSISDPAAIPAVYPTRPGFPKVRSSSALSLCLLFCCHSNFSHVVWRMLCADEQ